VFVSELLAISAALCIALSGMLINELKGRVDVIRLARWQMLAAFAMTGGAALVIGGWKTIGADEFALLAASSLFGIIIASTTYFAAIYTAGPRTTALLFTLASPFSLLLGYLFLGETIDMRQALGVGLVLAGIAMAVGLRRRDTVAAIEVSAAGVASIALKQSTPAWVGIALGIVTALGQALGSLMARPAMEAGVEPIAAMAVRSGIAALFLSRAGAAAVPVSAPALRIQAERCRHRHRFGLLRHRSRHVAVDGGSGDRQCRHRDDLVIHDPHHDSSHRLAALRRSARDGGVDRRGNRRGGNNDDQSLRRSFCGAARFRATHCRRKPPSREERFMRGTGVLRVWIWQSPMFVPPLTVLPDISPRKRGERRSHLRFRPSPMFEIGESSDTATLSPLAGIDVRQDSEGRRQRRKVASP
jgi:drug/metabolite transporter (DMT)-like permease